MKNSLQELEIINDSLISKGKELINAYDGIYNFDIFCISILNRTLNLNRGFINEINTQNFICAAPLVRLNLDSLLRIFSSQLIDYNVDDFAIKIINGEAIRDLKDNRGKKMTDTYLTNELNNEQGFDWVKLLYDSANGFVHFSDKHIFSSTKIDVNEKKIFHVITKNDTFIPESQKIIAIKYMVKITNGIIFFTNIWINQKKTYKNK